MGFDDVYWLHVQEFVQDGFIFIAWVAFLIMPKAARREYFFLGAFLCATFINEAITAVGYFVLHMNMNPVVNLSSLFYYTFLILFYKDRIQLKNSDTIAYTIIAMFLILASINMFIFQGIMAYDTYSWAAANACVVVVSFFHFYLLIKKTPFDQSMKKMPMFWINTAMLTFHSGTFFVYIFADYLANKLNDNLVVPFFIHHTFGIIFYIMISYALLMIRSEYQKGQITLNSFSL